MIHKACIVYLIPFIALLLFSSKIVFANVSENPVHKKVMISRRHLQIQISVVDKISVPIAKGAPGSGN
ncbi:hypothetical protein DVH24_030418 [Malus domestica]|uniref:Uncharacterized protein n=1 Tax=Malus domestica TaxID=3750 RepID=A0A498KRX6_MALDO|nr:hypothetical protein DVH24_030418 [Malus domestica]